ncbi:MAG: MlaD family protein [Gemmataceae bacterium]
MSEQKVRFRLGIFVLGALVLLAVMILLFGGLPTAFQSSDRYQITFDNAAGIGPGTPVVRSGVKIGQVESLSLDDFTGQVLVSIRVDPKFKLRKSDEPTLTKGLFGGDASIELVSTEAEDGQELDRNPLPPGSTVQGKLRVDAREMVQEASRLVNPAEQALKDLRKTFKRLEQIAPKAEAALDEFRQFTKAARDTIPKLDKTNQEIRGLAEDARKISPGFQDTNKDVQKLLKKFTEYLPKLTETTTEIKGLAKEVRNFLPEIKKSNQRIQDLSKDVGEFIPKVAKTNEEIQGLTKDVRKSIPELKKTNAEVQGLVKDVRKCIPDVKKTNAEVLALVKDFRKQMPELAITIDEIQLAARMLTRITERANLLLATNEENISRTIKSIEQTATNVADVFNEQNRKSVMGILKNLKNGTDDLDKLTENATAFLNDARELIASTRDSFGDIKCILSDVRVVSKDLAKRGPIMLYRTECMIAKINTVVDETNSLLKLLNRGNGTIQKLLRDPTIYNGVEKTITSVNNLMPRVQQILRDAATFADKLARHPELLGLRGAVAPSRGLKEMPPYPTVPNR